MVAISFFFFPFSCIKPLSENTSSPAADVTIPRAAKKGENKFIVPVFPSHVNSLLDAAMEHYISHFGRLSRRKAVIFNAKPDTY